MSKHLISIHDFSKEEIISVLSLAAKFEERQSEAIFRDKVIASLFFEPSTRTRLSFETAANRLGARIIGFSDAGNTSITKGESLKDTIKIVSNYADLIIIRHPLEGSARYASEVSSVPVINAGDGSNQHPSQTLLDLYSILKTQGRLDNLKINMVGDLKYGRTVHSLLQAMSHFNPYFIFTSPKELRMPDEYKEQLRLKGILFKESENLEEGLADVDIVYMTRVQSERFTDAIEYERVKNIYSLRRYMLESTKPNMKILHPLPRINEIHQDVDSSEHAYYFDQASNGVYTRMAIIKTLLGKVTSNK
jgi:aspartate carbamoyltransferase catalytic subunit